MRKLLGALLLALTCTPAWGVETLSSEPLAEASGVEGLVRPKRLVHYFDFEERKLGNYEDLPMHWYVTGRSPQSADPNFNRQPHHQALVKRDGFPEWTDVRFDSTAARSGKYGFKLGLNGGNAGAFLEIGTLPAVPTSDYQVNAWVKTEALDRAGARVVAYFIDMHGVEVPGSRTASAFLQRANDWTEVSLKLTGDFPTAAWIGLELEVLQPQTSLDDPLGKQQIVLRDVVGAAWFDDIGIWQLPHVEVSTQSPVNVIRGPQKPQLAVDVRDLTGQRLIAEVKIYDHRRRVVAQQERRIGAGEPMHWRWTPELPAFGWYMVDLVVVEDAPVTQVRGPIARTVSAMLWMPQPRPLPKADRYRFALAAEELPSTELALLPGILDAAGIDSVVMSAWARDTTLDSLADRQQEIDDALRNILTAGRSVTMSLHPVPKELAEQEGVESSHPLNVLRSDQKAWMPYVAPVLMRQGQRVRHWQLGQSQNAEAFFYGDLPALLSNVDREFSALAPQPKLILPWRLDQARRPDLSDEVVLAMDVPMAVTPEHIDAHLREWKTPASSYWLYLHEPPADAVAHEGRVTDLALRMIHGWEAGAAALALPKPWTAALERRNAVWPDPLLGVFSNVAQRLADRRLVGRLALGAGLDGMIFDAVPGSDRGGMLVACNYGADADDAIIDMYLGERPTVVDVFGNRSEVPLVDGRHRLQLGPDPLFIEGIDPELAKFRASFRITPSFVEALQQPHQHELALFNPWTRTISGSLRFTGPEGWNVSPQRHFFSLSPGQNLLLPITMTFPFAELAGPKTLRAAFDFTAEQHYEIELTAPLELGLVDVRFDPTVGLTPSAAGGDLMDAEVVCVITNTGEKPRSLSVFTNARNHPREERTVANLMPGQSIVRRFQYKGLSPTDRAQPLRTGIRELNGPAVLNRVLPLDSSR